MLRIRDEQMFVFDGRVIEDWVDVALPEVRRCWPSFASVSDERLRVQLRSAAREASALGLVSSGQWLRFANCALALGDDLRADPGAQAILAAPGPATIRLEKLVRWTFDTLRGR